MEVIFFDAAGTLIELTASVGEHYARVGQRFGVTVGAGALDAAFRDAWKSMSLPHPDGRGRADGDRGWWRQIVFAALDRCGESGVADREAYFAALYDYFQEPGVWRAFEEADEVLSDLTRRGGVRLAVLSNFDARLRVILEQLGLARYFEIMVISSEVGADKPDGRIFRHALEAMCVDPARALHVGDHPEMDWAGAERAGIRAFRLERPAVTLREVPTLLAG